MSESKVLTIKIDHNRLHKNQLTHVWMFSYLLDLLSIEECSTRIVWMSILAIPLIIFRLKCTFNLSGLGVLNFLSPYYKTQVFGPLIHFHWNFCGRPPILLTRLLHLWGDSLTMCHVTKIDFLKNKMIILIKKTF